MAPGGGVDLHKKNLQKILECDAGQTVTERRRPGFACRYPRCMNPETLRAVGRCRRALLELHALPPGSLPDELEDLIEDLIAPGFRERLAAAFLASTPHSGPPN